MSAIREFGNLINRVFGQIVSPKKYFIDINSSDENIILEFFRYLAYYILFEKSDLSLKLKQYLQRRTNHK